MSRAMEEENLSEWTQQVKDMIDNNKSLANAVAIPRVATHLLHVKQDAYIPHFVSLGPYHHSKLDKDFEPSYVGGCCYQYPELKMATAEAYKVQAAATLWQTHHNQGKSLDDIVEKIEGMRQEIESFYGWPIVGRKDKYSKNFALMMAIDASFLLSFLLSLFSQDPDMISLSTLQECTKCDILKLENQIPLSVLRNVFNDQNSGAGSRDFNKLLEDACTALCPFDFVDTANHNQIDMAKQRHLLGFMHSFFSPFLHMQAVCGTDNGADQRSLLQSTKHFLEVVVAAVLSVCVKHPTKEGRHDFMNSYNAGQLVKAGINFKSFSKPPHKIRFDTYSGTLYLPLISVSHMQSEVFLRNMIALEFNDATGGNHVTRYVGLMDCIIDTPEDVRVLRDCHVIRRGSLVLRDEWIGKMWNGLCHPFFTGELEPHDELKDALEEVLIRKYYMSIVKKVLWEVYWEHLSKPGKGVALVVGILLLAMTVVQTYCSLLELSRKN